MDHGNSTKNGITGYKKRVSKSEMDLFILSTNVYMDGTVEKSTQDTSNLENTRSSFQCDAHGTTARLFCFLVNPSWTSPNPFLQK